MHKIASPQDLQIELQQLLAYSQGLHPSRDRLAGELRGLAHRIEAGLTKEQRQQRKEDKVLARKAQDVATKYTDWLQKQGQPHMGAVARKISNLRSIANWLQSGKGGRGDRNEANRAIAELEKVMES